jgi:hypothetical protein
MTTTAQTILAHLGGNKFLAMTGAKNLVNCSRSLQFDLPRGAKNKANRVTITHTDADDYTVAFYRWDAKSLTLHLLHGDVAPFVQAESLRTVFTDRTGLAVSL